jgi:CMP-N-acetylneuraminic acid synthetase
MGIHYGVDEGFKRDISDSSSTSLDIHWLTNLYASNRINTEYFAILRPTSPQRSVNLITECVRQYLESGCDSLRTISLVQEHPGKMWRLNSGGIAQPYLTQQIDQPASHAMQYGSLETLYVQTSVFEIARTEVIVSTKSREGKSIYGFLTSGVDSFAIDTPSDLDYLEFMIAKNSKLLPEFKAKHPDCIKSSSPYSDQYNKLIVESMGGSGDNDIEKENKIIKKIAKEVTIDKVIE